MKKNRMYNFAILLFAASSAYIIIYNIIRQSYIQALLGLITLAFLLICPLAEIILRVKLDEAMRTFVVLFSLFAFNIGTVMEWYIKYEYYSFFIHGISGILYTQIGFYIYFIVTGKKEVDLRKNWILALSYAVFFTMTIAAVWEIFEYFTYLITGRDVQHTLDTGIHDTMLDLISCLAGSIFMAVNYLIYVWKEKQSFFVRMISEFYEKNKA